MNACSRTAGCPASTIGQLAGDGDTCYFDAVLELTLRDPMMAVGREPDPAPWHGLSFAPLRVVASEHSAAGADVWNVDGPFPAVPTAKGRTGQ